MKSKGPVNVSTVWLDPTAGGGGGGGGGGGSEPGLTVTGRTDGSVTTVTGGAARSLTIQNPDGAALLTTVTSDTGAVSVTDSTTTTPSWTAPAGGENGASVQVLVTATLGGLSTHVSFTEHVSGVTPSEPTLTITGRTAGGGYSVSAGARSITIQNPDGAGLNTTVRRASNGSSITVTNAATTNPSWTAPSGGELGESVQVLVTATKSGLSTTVGFTEFISGVNPLEPSITVTDRADGSAHVVSAGARALSISNPDGATLLTTVTLASDGSSVTVTDPATTTPSWTAPSGGSIGESVQVSVTATLGALSSVVAFTEKINGTGVSGSDPGLTVTGRVDGGAYLVTTGASRSITIQNPDSGTLLTEVTSDILGPITVTNPTSTTPSWTAPAGTAFGSSVQVKVTTTIGGLSAQVSFTERINANGITSVTDTELLDTWDFRTADATTLSGTGTITRDAGGTNVVDYRVFVQSGSVSSSTTDISSAGLRIFRNNGSSVSGITFDIADVIALGEERRDTYLFFVYFSGVNNPTMVTNQSFGVDVSVSNNSISKTPTRGMMLLNSSTSNLNVTVREYDGSVTTVTERSYGSAWPTSGTALLEVQSSRVYSGWSDASNPPRSAVTMGNAGTSNSDTAPSSAPPLSPFNHLQIWCNPRSGGNIELTVTHIEVRRLAAGAS